MFTTVRDARGRHVSTRATTLALLFTLAACSGGDGGTTTPPPAAVAASVAVSAAESGALTAIGATRPLTAVVKDASQATLSGAAVSWTSNNAAVATVSASGSSATVLASPSGSVHIGDAGHSAVALDIKPLEI